MRGRLSIKNLAISFFHFITRRGKLVGLLIVLVTVLYLAVLLSGYMFLDITSNYQSSSTIPQQSSITTPDNASTNIPNQGKIIIPNTVSDAGVLKTIGVGVYWNPDLTSKASTTDWGILQPCTQKSLLVYVHNEGNSPVTLSLSTSNWTPSTASSYFALTWNYNGQTINPNTQLQLTLTLTVSSHITGISGFSFDIIITASS
jgi:hypothetical protein